MESKLDEANKQIVIRMHEIAAIAVRISEFIEFGLHV